MSALRLFQGFGIELEYMIVDAQSLAARPIADQLLAEVAGGPASDYSQGDTAWSNELVLHVIELKTDGPAPSLSGLAGLFQRDLTRINQILSQQGAVILPTAMHPWFDPRTETRIWPHEYTEVYRTFDRIFDCRGHGWSNLQSMHINLPFGDAEEFGKLHAAIRLVLPILPALAASSPIVEGRITGLLDNRLSYYRMNSRRIPSATGKVIPEQVFTPDDYQQRILERIYADTAPLDPEGVLAHEFANARGAIARFDRGAIEIRVIDVQECPAADLAIAELVVAVVRALVEEKLSPAAVQRAFEVAPLHTHFISTMVEGESAIIADREYLAALGLPRSTHAIRAQELWQHLAEVTACPRSPALELILSQGSLSSRILRAVGGEASRGAQEEVYRALIRAAATGEPLRA
ncbi:MAG: glutamate-cysteine ligase family protein [Myxococcota bacterium]